MEKINIYEWLSDWDNPELDDYEHDEQLKEAVQDYNEQFGTNYNPDRCIKAYKTYVRLKDRDLPE